MEQQDPTAARQRPAGGQVAVEKQLLPPGNMEKDNKRLGADLARSVEDAGTKQEQGAAASAAQGTRIEALEQECERLRVEGSMWKEAVPLKVRAMLLLQQKQSVAGRQGSLTTGPARVQDLDRGDERQRERQGPPQQDPSGAGQGACTEQLLQQVKETEQKKRESARVADEAGVARRRDIALWMLLGMAAQGKRFTALQQDSEQLRQDASMKAENERPMEDALLQQLDSTALMQADVARKNARIQEMERLNDGLMEAARVQQQERQGNIVSLVLNVACQEEMQRTLEFKCFSP